MSNKPPGRASTRLVRPRLLPAVQPGDRRDDSAASGIFFLRAYPGDFALDCDTLQVRWSSDSIIGTSGNSAFAFDNGQLVSIDMATGFVRWRSTEPGLGAGEYAVSNDLIAVHRRDKTRIVVRADSGKTAWTASVPDD